MKIMILQVCYRSSGSVGLEMGTKLGSICLPILDSESESFMHGQFNMTSMLAIPTTT